MSHFQEDGRHKQTMPNRFIKEKKSAPRVLQYTTIDCRPRSYVRNERGYRHHQYTFESLRNQICAQNILKDSFRLSIDEGRRKAYAAVNISVLYTYYEIGKRIVLQEQKGRRWAGYGEKLLILLSEELSKRFGKGYSATNLKLFRLFYRTYSKEMGEHWRSTGMLANSSMAIDKFENKRKKTDDIDTIEKPLNIFEYSKANDSEQYFSAF